MNHTEAIGGGPQIFFITKHEVSLHRRTERIDMAIGMFAWERILVFSKCIVILVVNKAFSEIEVALVTAALISEEEVFRERIGFIPGVSDILVWPTRYLFRPAERFLGQMRQHCVRRPL